MKTATEIFEEHYGRFWNELSQEQQKILIDEMYLFINKINLLFIELDAKKDVANFLMNDKKDKGILDYIERSTD